MPIALGAVGEIVADGSAPFILPVTGPIGTITITTNPGVDSHTWCISTNPDSPKYCSVNQFAYDLTSTNGGWPVAVADGVVSYVDDKEGGGNCLILAITGYDLSAQYCHLADGAASFAGPHKKGDKLGDIGNTGSESKGPHLHFSLLRKNASNWTGVSSVTFINFSSVNGYNINESRINAPTPNQPVGIIDLSVLGGAVNDIYNKSLGIGGLLALAIIVYGGLLHILSGANIVAQKEAKEWILAAIYGLIILALAYFILNNINPCLVGKVNCPFIR